MSSTSSQLEMDWKKTAAVQKEIAELHKGAKKSIKEEDLDHVRDSLFITKKERCDFVARAPSRRRSKPSGPPLMSTATAPSMRMNRFPPHLHHTLSVVFRRFLLDNMIL